MFIKSARKLFTAAALIGGLAASSTAQADEDFALAQVKAMAEYLQTQEALSFGFNATLEIITK